MVKCLNLILFLLLHLVCWGQVAADSASVRDSLPGSDSITQQIIIPFLSLPDSIKWRDTLPSTRRDTIIFTSEPLWGKQDNRFLQHPYFRFTNPVRITESLKQREGREALFYVVIGLVLFFALLRNGFGRYIQDLFKIFFRTTVRQRQIKEQLLQSPLPSLLLNIFFLCSMGMFIALAIRNLGWMQGVSFWLLLFYAILVLVGLYFLKFLVLKVIGWILQAREVADTYIFIVFTTNKVIGMLLLPVIIVLALTQGSISQVAFTTGLIMIGGFFAYRYFLSFVSVYRQLKISFFHFLIYLLAFEIVPLLLINKLLFTFLMETS